MHRLAAVLLWVAGLGFLGFGVAFLLAPLRAMAAAGIALEGAIAATELRAFYGGLEVALGVLIVATALVPGRLRDGLVLTLSSYGAIGATRLVTMLATGTDTPFLRYALLVELGVAVLAGALLWALRAAA
jgi:hypothetical protein